MFRLEMEHSKERIARAHMIALPAVLEDQERFLAALETEHDLRTEAEVEGELGLRGRLAHAGRYADHVRQAGLSDSTPVLGTLAGHLTNYLDGDEFPENQVAAALNLLAQQATHRALWARAGQTAGAVRQSGKLPSVAEVDTIVRKLKKLTGEE